MNGRRMSGGDDMPWSPSYGATGCHLRTTYRRTSRSPRIGLTEGRNC
jgi:hypothetical protein